MMGRRWGGLSRCQLRRALGAVGAVGWMQWVWLSIGVLDLQGGIGLGDLRLVVLPCP